MASKLAKDMSDYINEVFEIQGNRIFNERKIAMVEEFSKQLDLEKDKIISAVVLRLSKLYSIETRNKQIIITVEDKRQ